MDSANIGHVPLNRTGALELGVIPCSICNFGFANYCGTTSYSCHDTCEYYKIYFNKEEMEKINIRKYKK